MIPSRNVRPFLSNGAPGSRAGKAGGRLAAPRTGSASGSRRTRGASPARTPAAASSARRPRRVDDEAGLRVDDGFGVRFIASSAPASRIPAASRRAAYDGIGSRADQ